MYKHVFTDRFHIGNSYPKVYLGENPVSHKTNTGWITLIPPRILILHINWKEHHWISSKLVKKWIGAIGTSKLTSSIFANTPWEFVDDGKHHHTCTDQMSCFSSGCNDFNWQRLHEREIATWEDIPNLLPSSTICNRPVLAKMHNEVKPGGKNLSRCIVGVYQRDDEKWPANGWKLCIDNDYYSIGFTLRSSNILKIPH
jgi:hypothetical protein